MSDQNATAAVALLVPPFGLAAAMAVAAGDGDGMLLKLASAPHERRLDDLGNAVADAITTEASGHLSVMVVSLGASADEIRLYADRAATALGQTGRDRHVHEWDLTASTVDDYRPGLGVQDAVLAFSRYYELGRLSLAADPVVRDLLTAQLEQYRAGRRTGLDAETGIVGDALILAAGTAIRCCADDLVGPRSGYDADGPSVDDY